MTARWKMCFEKTWNREKEQHDSLSSKCKYQDLGINEVLEGENGTSLMPWR